MDDALAAVDPAHVQGDVVAVLDELARLVDNLPVDALDAPSGCGSWTVRALLNHIVFENLAHTALATGSEMPGPDAVTDHLGADPVAAFHASATLARTALTDPGLLDRTFGPTAAPGSFVAQMLVNEQLTHGWDLAAATGQSRDLAPDAARRALPAARAFYGAVPRGDVTYAEERAVPDDASAADRLAAYLGRNVRR